MSDAQVNNGPIEPAGGVFIAILHRENPTFNGHGEREHLRKCRRDAVGDVWSLTYTSLCHSPRGRKGSVILPIGTEVGNNTQKEDDVNEFLRWC